MTTSMTTTRGIQRDPAAAAEIEREQLAGLERELATEQTFLDACKTFRDALDAYAATYPDGLDRFDPDSQLREALVFSLLIRRATMSGIRQRMKETRLRVKCAGGRRLS